MRNLRQDLISDRRRREERSAGKTFRHEDQSDYGSMHSMRYSEIAASLRIFVCPGRMQPFAKFPQKLFWIKRASDKRQTGQSEIEVTHPGSRHIKKKLKSAPKLPIT
jgi:hypothetical protein